RQLKTKKIISEGVCTAAHANRQIISIQYQRDRKVAEQDPFCLWKYFRTLRHRHSAAMDLETSRPLAHGKLEGSYYKQRERQTQRTEPGKREKYCRGSPDYRTSRIQLCQSA